MIVRFYEHLLFVSLTNLIFWFGCWVIKLFGNNLRSKSSVPSGRKEINLNNEYFELLDNLHDLNCLDCNEPLWTIDTLCESEGGDDSDPVYVMMCGGESCNYEVRCQERFF